MDHGNPVRIYRPVDLPVGFIFLVCHNHPPIIIHEEDRKIYYNALEAWDTEQALEPLCSFLQDQAAKTWGKQLARAKSTER